jgi:DNA-binding MarR family transcriptional regulator
MLPSGTSPLGRPRSTPPPPETVAETETGVASPELVARDEALDLVATTLVSRTSRLARLLMGRGSRQLSRTEAGLLATLLEAPRRVTELAETEGLAQPSVSKLVDKLEERGLVWRGRAPGDGRVVVVSISGEGRRCLDAVRSEIRALLRQTLVDLDPDDLAVLVAASGVVQRLVRSLQGSDLPRGGGPA